MAEGTENTSKIDKPWQFKPGNSGKPTGATNHLTKTVKETVLAVFNEIQSDPQIALKSFARKYPRDFYAIAARLIPTEITGTIKQVITVTDVREDEEQPPQDLIAV